MAVILKRTVFAEKVKNGVIRFLDWARVITPIGAMVEPFNMNDRTPVQGNFPDFDPEDEMSRVDEIEFIDINREKQILSGGANALHGGTMMPRVGR